MYAAAGKVDCGELSAAKIEVKAERLVDDIRSVASKARRTSRAQRSVLTREASEG